MPYSIRGGLLLTACILTGCAGSAYQIDKSIAEHRRIASQIQLGDSKEKVVPLLESLQEMLEGATKPPEMYMKDDTMIYIHFARTARQPDGMTTDDEFTPYVFHDGKLVGVGWSTIGGAKSFGQATSDINISAPTIIY